MTTALFGLLGVVVGGLLTGGIDYVANRREERATGRTLARALFASLLEFRSQCIYCRNRGSWLLIAEPLKLPAVWTDHELVWGRLFTWDEWTGLHAVRAAQVGLRQAAMLATENPALHEPHLPIANDAALAAIDHVLPLLEHRAAAGGGGRDRPSVLP